MCDILSLNNPICQGATAPNKVVIYADGLCEPVNPGGYGCWGWAAFSDDVKIASDHGCIGIGKEITNNVVEYYAVIQALQYAQHVQNGIEIEVLTDSQLVVHQINGDWNCRAANLLPLCVQAIALIKRTNAKLRWVTREQNQRAEEQSIIAYRKAKNGKGGERK